MTFERFVALLAVVAGSHAWGLVVMANVWGFWPVSWAWWVGSYPISLALAVLTAKLCEPRE